MNSSIIRIDNKSEFKMSIRKDLQDRLKTIVKHFRVDELESCVVPYFPETSWNYIKTRLIEDGCGCTVKNAWRIIEEVITVNQIHNTILRERLITLELIEVSRHYKKRTWHTFALLEPTADVKDDYSNDELKSRIIAILRTDGMNLHVEILTHDGVIYISMRDVSKMTKRDLKSPAFFAFFPGQEYIFCSKIKDSNKYLLSLVDSLGYRKTKIINLVDHDLHALMKLLITKERGAVDRRDCSRTRTSEDPLPVYTRMGMDFRRNKQRRQYINQCFGDEPPTLQSFTVKFESETWEDPDIRAKLPDENIIAEISFQGPNVADLLSHLAEQKILTSPLPDYVTDAMKLGKNKCTVREVGDSHSH